MTPTITRRSWTSIAFFVSVVFGVFLWESIVELPTAQSIVEARGGRHGSYIMDYPKSMQDFVDRSSVIISGTIVTREFLGWTTKNYSGPNGELVIEAPDVASIRATPYIEITAEIEGGANETIRVSNISRGWKPYTEYHIEIDHIFRSDGTIMEGDEVVLHKIGTLDENNEHGGPTPPLSVGGEHVFALTRTPDGVSFGQQFAGASCLKLGIGTVGTDEVYEMWNTPSIVAFTLNTEVGDFLSELEDALVP